MKLHSLKMSGVKFMLILKYLKANYHSGCGQNKYDRKPTEMMS